MSYVSIEFLPPAYILPREGNVLTRVCLSVHRPTLDGGVPTFDRVPTLDGVPTLGGGI